MILFELDFPVFRVTLLKRFQAIRLQLDQQRSATFISDPNSLFLSQVLRVYVSRFWKRRIDQGSSQYTVRVEMSRC